MSKYKVSSAAIEQRRAGRIGAQSKENVRRTRERRSRRIREQFREIRIRAPQRS